jgi:hypothetical protein
MAPDAAHKRDQEREFDVWDGASAPPAGIGCDNIAGLRRRALRHWPPPGVKKI